MADKIRGITVELGADTSGISEGLKSVNKELKSTESQLKDVERLLKLDPTNTELLAQKQKLLKDAIGDTKTKLEALKKAEETLKAKGVDENSAQFLALKREIEATELKSRDYEKQLGETEEAMNGETTAAKNEEKAVKASGETAEKTEKSHDGLKKTLVAVGTAFAATAAAATAAATKTVKALATMTRDGAKYADDLLTQSKITGLSTDELQEYAYAAELVDVSLETLTSSMTKNVQAMKNAEKSKDIAAAYKQLGVNIRDANGEYRDSKEVYRDVIAALGKIENETERDVLAMTLLGKSAKEINPLIEAGADTLSDLAKEAHDTGYVMSKDTLEAYGALDDNIQRINNGITALKNGLGTILLPIITAFTGEFSSLIGELSAGFADANGDVTKMGAVINKILPKAMAALKKYLPLVTETIKTILGTALQILVEMAPDLIKTGAELLETLIGSIVDNLPEITAAASKLLVTLATALISAAPKLARAAVSMVTTLVTELTKPETLAEIIKAGVELITALVSDLPSIIKTLAAAAVNIVTALAAAFGDPKLLQDMIDAGVTLLTSLISDLPEITKQLLAAAGTLVTSLVTAFTDPETIKKIAGAGEDLMTSLTTNVPEIIAGIIETLPQIIDGLVGALTDEKTLETMLDAGKKLFLGMILTKPKMMVAVAEKIAPMIEGLIEKLTDKEELEKMGEAGLKLLGELWNNVEALAKDFAREWGDLIDRILKLILGEENAEKLKKAGEDMFDKIWDGLKQKWEDVKDWFNGIVGWISDVWSSIFGTDTTDATSEYVGSDGRIITKGSSSGGTNLSSVVSPSYASSAAYASDQPIYVTVEMTGSMATLAQNAQPFWAAETTRRGLSFVK